MHTCAELRQVDWKKDTVAVADGEGRLAFVSVKPAKLTESVDAAAAATAKVAGIEGARTADLPLHPWNAG